MKTGTPDDPVPGLDALERAYREAGFDDAPPPELDAAIRAAAERAARRRYHQYLPPLAVAATLVVAVGLLLRVTALSPERFDDRAPAQRALESVPPAPAAEPQSAPPPTPLHAPAPAGEPAAEIRAEEGLASFRAASPAVADGPPEPDATAALAPCAAPRPLAPDAWLACVAAALDAGSLNTARSELEAFEAEYPDYPVPSALTERLGP